MHPRSPRIVWITGASSGIGQALGREFASHGDHVILTARTEASLADLHAELENTDRRSTVLLCDVRDEQSVSLAAREILNVHGRLDILINNAGITIFKEFLNTSVREFDDILATNLRGVFLATRSILPSMIDRGDGLIMNVVSYAAKATYTESSIYSATKAGVASMMDGLRAEVRRKGIKIVNVFPGAVKTPIWHQKVLNRYGDQMMIPADVARMIYDVSCQSRSLMVEEITVRPQGGDLQG
jgi:3-oxoacyl-[acyl-carrier protein] reductase